MRRRALVQAGLAGGALAVLAACAPTINVKVQRDRANRPFGFVQFQNIADAKAALKQSPGTHIDDRDIRVEPANVIRTLFISRIGAHLTHKVRPSISVFLFISLSPSFSPLPPSPSLSRSPAHSVSLHP